MAAHRASETWILAGAAILLGGCQLVSGLSDYGEASSSAGAGAGGGGGAGAGTSSAGGAGGEGGMGGGGGAGGGTTSSGQGGGCGYDCLGGDCDGTVCGPVKINDTTEDEVDLLAIDDTYAYWARYDVSGTLWRVLLTGGDATAFLTGVQARGLAADGGAVYWTDSVFDGGFLGLGAKPDIEFMPTSGPGARGLICSEEAAGQTIVADGQQLFWTMASGQIRRASAQSGQTSVEVASGASPDRIAVDSTHVYYRDGAGVRRAPRGGGSAEAVADAAAVNPPDEAIYGIAVDAAPDGFVYIATSSAAGNLSRAKKDGSMPEAFVLSEALVSARTLVVDDTHVYWAEHSSNCATGTEGKVRRMPIDGGDPEDLVEGLKCPQMAQDDKSIVYSDGVKIFRLAKPPAAVP